MNPSDIIHGLPFRRRASRGLPLEIKKIEAYPDLLEYVVDFLSDVIFKESTGDFEARQQVTFLQPPENIGRSISISWISTNNKWFIHSLHYHVRYIYSADTERRIHEIASRKFREWSGQV